MALGSGSSARRIGMWAYDQAQGAKKEGQDLLSDYLGRGLASLGQGFDQARTDLNTQYTGAIGRLDPWADAGKNALGVYQGSLGLGGDAARDSAVASYRASPGYERRVAEATDAVARKASALGALGSGNTMQAISDRANYLADEDYGRWQGQLQGLSDRGQQAATTQAGLQGQLGNQLGNLGQAQGTSEAGLYGQYAGLGLGNIWNATNSGINSVQQAQQRATDSVNSGWSLGLNALGSGLGLLGLPMGGGATLGGNLLNFARGR